MNTFLLKFEAIESRIASISCPKGTSGRLHSLRLRRCFRVPNRRPQSTASGKLILPLEEAPEYQNQGGNLVENTEPVRKIEGGNPVWKKVAALREKDLRRERLRKSTRFTGTWENQDEESFDPPESVKHDTVPTAFPESDNANPSAIEDTLFQALRENDPHAALDALVRLVRVDEGQYTSIFLQSLPPNTFSAILRFLDPEHFVGRYGKLYTEMSPGDLSLLGLPDVEHSGYHQFCVTFLSQIEGIVAARKRHHRIFLVDFKYLLKCARATGNVAVARSLWKDMHSLRLTLPDVECYNLFLGTICWTEQFNPYQRYRLRVAPNNLLPRAWSTTVPYRLNGHRVGGSQGIKAQASRLFKEMVNRGVSGDEQTFCLMITALAREGDTDGIASILDRVWGIDVEALLTSHEEDLPSVKSYTLDSPLHPSQELLSTLAHIYGINNSVPTALRLIDYVSRQYDVPIPLAVWGELLQWTFVLSIPRSPRQMEKMEDFRIGHLPHEAVLNLWNTMTSEPYNVKPTMQMFSRVIVSLLRLQRFGQAKIRMEEARKLYEEHVLDVSRRVSVCKENATENTRAAKMDRRDLEFAMLRQERFKLYIRRWVRMYIRRSSKALKYDATLIQENIPQFLRYWNEFLPPIVVYHTASGVVQFKYGTRFEWLSEDQDRNKSDKQDLEMWEYKQDDFDDID